MSGASSSQGLARRRRGRQAALPVIGYLSAAGENSQWSGRDAFRQGLSELGFVEGRNVEVVYSYADTQNDRLRALAAELVRRRVSVIAAVGSPASPLAAKSETATIPIVFVLGTDPVDGGLVASLNWPGANVTGVNFLTTLLVAKRLELLHEVKPATTSIGFLLNPTDPTIESQVQEAETAARTLGIRLVILKAGTPKAKSPTNCRSSRRRKLSWSSTSRPPRHSALPFCRNLLAIADEVIE